MFNKGDRVVVVKAANSDYAGRTGVIVCRDGKVWKVLDDKTKKELWYIEPSYVLELIDEPIVEEDWS